MLTKLAPELVHNVALSGYLTHEEVAALAQTCRRLASILVWDTYGRDLHFALKGVVENVRRQRWSAARYAVRRRWFVESDEERVWRDVASVVVGKGKMALANASSLTGWENVMLEALVLPAASGGWLEMWSYPHTYEEKETYLFQVAARMGSERIVDWLINHGGDLEATNSDRATPLFAACEGGNLAIVKKLVSCGADVTTKDRNLSSVLGAASKEGHPDVLRFLLGLESLNLPAEGADVSSPLNLACVGNHPQAANLLLEKGADVDVEGEYHYGPLFRACQDGNHEIARLLVDAGAWSNVGKDGGLWVRGLVTASFHGYVDVIRVLLDAGVDVDGLDAFGNTALCTASRYGSVNGVRVLVEEGSADVDKTGEEGWTPLICASWAGEVDLVRVLLEAGADVGVRDPWGDTAADVAREMGRDGVVGVLHEWGGGE